MAAELGAINRIDNKTMRAMVCAATAAGIGYMLDGSVKKAAAAAALTGISIWSRSPTKNLDYAGKETGKNDKKGKPIVVSKINKPDRPPTDRSWSSYRICRRKGVDGLGKVQRGE